MRRHPALRRTLRADVIEKRCKITAFERDYQIFLTKSNKFLKTAESSLQIITKQPHIMTYCQTRLAKTKLLLSIFCVYACINGKKIVILQPILHQTG